MYRLIIVTAIFLVLFTYSGHGQAQPNDPADRSVPSAGPAMKAPGSFLSLQQAIRLGLAHHPLIERSRSSSRIARAITKQTQGERYPWLEASVAGASGSLRIITSDGRTIHDRGGHGFDPGGALPQHNQNMLTGGLILNQLITDFGYTAHRILANQAKESATEKEILTNKALVILNVQKAYLNCLLQERLVRLAGETVTRRSAVRDQIAVLHKHNLKSKVDLDLVNVEVSNAELSLIKARNDLNQYMATLNNAMGVEGPGRYDLEPISVDTSRVSEVEPLVEEGLRHRPELLEGRDRLQVTAELLKAVKALNFGSLSGVGTIGLTKYWDVHSSGIHDDEIAPFWGLGATARVPLFTGFKLANQAAEARHLNGEAEHDLQNLANEVILQIIRAHLTQTTNAEQVALERERVSYANEALTLAQERYRLGLSPIVEVIRGTTTLFEAESRLLEAQYLYKMSEAAVAYAAGQDYRKY